MRFSPEIRVSQEFQSAIIRMSIWAFMLPMLALARYVGDYSFTWDQYMLLFGVHLFWYGGILVSTIVRPQLWRARTYFSLFADLSGTTGTLFLTGDATGPFYLLYAVSFLSQGMRYGKTNLLTASLCSLLAFAFVAAVLGDWRTQTLALASTRHDKRAATSKTSWGSGRSSGSSLAAAAPTVSARALILRASSRTSAAARATLSAASDPTCGTGVRWRRRNRPISPSTPPFSCAPSMPGMQKNES